jgi:hypothetical protein
MRKFRNMMLERLKKTPKMIFRAKNKSGRPTKNTKTDEAHIFVINYKGKPAIFRHKNNSEKASKRNYLAHKIAKELFPKNMLNPLGVTTKEVEINLTDNVKRKMKLSGIVTDIVKKRSKDYKDYQKRFYNQNKRTIPDHPHEKWFNENAREIAKEIRIAGILIEDNAVNTINSGGTPVFVEVRNLASEGVINYITKQNFSAKKKERLINLVFEYNRTFG